MIRTAPVIETARLTITALSLDHWEAYAAAWADPDLTAFIGGKPRSRQESWTKFTQGVGLWPLFGYGYWAFLDRETWPSLNAGSTPWRAIPKRAGPSSRLHGGGAWQQRRWPGFSIGQMARWPLKSGALSIPVIMPPTGLRPSWALWPARPARARPGRSSSIGGPARLPHSNALGLPLGPATLEACTWTEFLSAAATA